MALSFDGQVALVTGGSRGIGRAVATHLAANGACVFVNFVRDDHAAAETLRRITEAGGRGELAKFDVSDSDAVDRGTESVLHTAGRLDILVNNAGVTVDNLLIRLRPEEWDRVMAVSLRGTYNCTRACLRPMIKARYGRIVNVSSVIALMGNAGQAAYAAAKAGILGFTKAMAREVASRSITVNAVAPGLIETEMAAGLPEDRRSEYLKIIPAGRLGTVDEVADVVGFLVRPQSGYITGQIIGVNGGLYM